MSPRSSNPSIRLLRRVMFSTAGLDLVKSIPGFILLVALSLAAIGLTTLVIIEAHSNSTALRDWRDPEHLTLAYLLPPIFVAVFFGSRIVTVSREGKLLHSASLIRANSNTLERLPLPASGGRPKGEIRDASGPNRGPYYPKSRRRDGGAGEAVTRPVAVICRTTRIWIGSPFLLTA